ncbi:hypothetical protein KAH55_03700 [bacterium]|nr:hypothetical protein [bacterium]
MLIKRIIVYLVIFTGIFSTILQAQFPAENLEPRALNAFSQGYGKIYLSWRVLHSDRFTTSYAVYRSRAAAAPVKIAEVDNSSNYLDDTAESGASYTYFIRPLNNSVEGTKSNSVDIISSGASIAYRQINLHSRKGLVHLAAGDFNADGEFDFLAQTPGFIDPATSETYSIEAYQSDGTFLWSKNTGIGPDPIDGGPTWTMSFLCWDLDDDQKAEAILRMNSGKDHYMVAYDGITGVEKSRIIWPEGANRLNNRHVIAIAYLDGPDAKPSVILQVGTYDEVIVGAYDFVNGQFQVRWSVQDVGDGTAGHGIEIVDYDNDGHDEILQGATLIDEYGEMVWSTYLGHMDIMTVGDIKPDNDGLEVFYGTCWPWDAAREGMFVVDMDDGQVLWEHSDQQMSNLYHIHGGWAADVTPDYPGWECWAHNKPNYSGPDEPYLYVGETGELISNEWITNQDPISWDDDDSMELTAIRGANGSYYTIFDYPDRNKNKIIDIYGAHLLTMDLLGDFRDEFVVADKNAFFIWTNVDVSRRKKISPLFDRHYRLDVARTGSGYFRYSNVLYLDLAADFAAEVDAPAPPLGLHFISEN